MKPTTRAALMHVTVEGFIGHKYGDLVLSQAFGKESRAGKFTSCYGFQGYACRCARILQHAFRGETGMLQLVMAEFKVTRHMHGGVAVLKILLLQMQSDLEFEEEE